MSEPERAVVCLELTCAGFALCIALVIAGNLKL